MTGAQRRQSNWTAEEDRLLLELVEAGKSWVFIAANLKRPAKSARQHLAYLRQPIRPRTRWPTRRASAERRRGNEGAAPLFCAALVAIGRRQAAAVGNGRRKVESDRTGDGPHRIFGPLTRCAAKYYLEKSTRRRRACLASPPLLTEAQRVGTNCTSWNVSRT